MINCNVDILFIGQATCTQGSIRLQGGTNTNGRVEVCHINIWGTLCGGSSWVPNNALVACRQLGLPTTGATNHTVYTFPDATQVNWFRYVRCVGNESSLFNCNNIPPSEFNCFRLGYAGVSCQDSKSCNLKPGFLSMFSESVQFYCDSNS